MRRFGLCSSGLSSSLILILAVAAGCSSKSTVTATPGDSDAGDGADADGSTPPGPPSEWTWRGGDLGSTYNNKNETKITVDNVSQLVEAWTVDLGVQTNGVAPSVGGKVFPSAVNKLHALDVEGNPLWENPSAGGYSSPAYSEGTVFTNTANGTLVAVNAEDGTTIWSKKIDPHPNAAGFGSPTVFESMVIVGSTSGEESYARANATFRGSVVAYNKMTGQEVWRHYTVDAPNNGASIWSSPAIDAEARVVFVGTGNNYTENATLTSDSILALNVDTGALVWNTQMTKGDVYTTLTEVSDDSDFGANPFLFEASVKGTMTKLVGAGQKSGAFTVLDRTTGDVIWTQSLGPGSALSGGIFNNGAFDGTNLLVVANGAKSTGAGSEPRNGDSPSTGVSRLMALDPATGTIVWERQLPAWVWSPISVANGVGYVAYETQVQAFNVATGEKLAVVAKVTGTIASGISIADGHVFFGSGMSYVVGHKDSHFHCLELAAP